MTSCIHVGQVFRLSTPHHSLNVSLKEYSVPDTKNSHLYINSFCIHIYSISYSISPTISYPLSSLSFSLILLFYRHARAIGTCGVYCSKCYCSVWYSVARCSSSITLFSVQSGLPICTADSLSNQQVFTTTGVHNIWHDSGFKQVYVRDCLVANCFFVKWHCSKFRYYLTISV
jgi:hypothetical protein